MRNAKIMAGEIMVAAALNQVWQQVILAKSLSLTTLLPPAADAHIMSQCTPRDDRPDMRS